MGEIAGALIETPIRHSPDAAAPTARTSAPAKY